MLRKWTLVICAVVIVCGLSQESMAQTSTARITGLVSDATGGVVPGVDIVVRNVETGIQRSFSTDESGRYSAPELVPGSYEITATLVGFDTLVRSGITLTVGQQVSINLTMQVGAITQQVTVTGEAPLVNTTTSGVSGVVEERRISELPLNGRDFSSLALVQPGVFSIRNASEGANKGYGTRVSMAGSRPMETGWVLDGSSINSVGNFGTPGAASDVVMGVDSVREFRVVSGGGYGADLGAHSGGVIQMVTKSGTNSLHGSVYEFLRNDNVDATRWANNRANKEKPEFRRNQFGASLGGPIARDKVFFFGNVEGLRQARVGDIRTDLVPDANVHNGLIPDGEGGLKQVEIAASVKPYLDLWPLPNGPLLGDGVGRRFTPTTNITNENYFVTRWDYYITPNQTIFGRFTLDDADDSNPSALGISNTLNASRFRYSTLQSERIMSPTMLSTSRVSYNRSGISPGAELNIDYPESLYFLGSEWPPQLSYAGVGSLGIGGVRPGFRILNTYQLSQAFSYTRGAHSMKFGGDFRRLVMHLEAPAAGAFGSFTWDSVEEFLTDDLMEFVVQVPGSSTARSLTQNMGSMYFQDDWQMRPNFTLNMGLRYEPWAGPGEKHDRISTVRDWVTQTEFSTPETDGTDKLFNPAGEKAFSPRLGFAWDVKGDGKTAVRAGAGIFPVVLGMQFFHTVARKNPPFAGFVNSDFETNLAGAADLAREIGPSFLTTTMTPSTFAEIIQFDMDPMYEFKFNLSVEREITPDLSVTLGYMGNQSTHITEKTDCNLRQSIKVNGRSFVESGTPRPNQNMGVMTCTTTDGKSFYNAMTLEVKKRLSRGFQLQGSYTWSKTVDDGTTGLGNSDFSEGTRAQAWDTKSERGLSSLHLGHNLVLNGLWSLPSPVSEGLANHLFGGWQLSGIFTTTTGAPHEISLRGRVAPDGSRSSSNQHPDLVAGRNNANITSGTTAGCTFSRAGFPGPYDASAPASSSVLPGQEMGTANFYYDPCAFSMPPPAPAGYSGGFYGNVGRNTLIGPGFINMDISILKTMPVGINEGSRLQFHADFFNLFNHPNFGRPGSRPIRVRGGGSRGELTAGEPEINNVRNTERQIQFGLKLVF